MAARTLPPIWIGIASLLLVAATACRDGWAANLDSYGRLPALEDVSVSPDGQKIAFVQTQGDARQIAVYSLAEKKAIKVIRVGDVKLRTISWADDLRILVTTSSPRMPWGLIGEDQEWYLLQVIDLRTSWSRPVPDINRVRDGIQLMNVLSGEVMVRKIDGHTVLFVPGIYLDTRSQRCLVRYDLDTDRQSVMVHGDSRSLSWLVGPRGNVVAALEYAEDEKAWRIRMDKAGKLEEVASGKEAIDVPEILGLGPSEDTLLLQSTVSGNPTWLLLSLKDGSIEPYEEDGTGLTKPLLDPETDRMIGGARIGDDDEYGFLDKTRQARWDSIVRAFGTNHISFVSASSDFTKIVVLVRGDTLGYQYQLVDMETHRTRPIGDVYDGISGPLPKRRIEYPAADGLRIPGYLTLPPDREATRLPLVVLPHGGPAAADTMRFDWWSQALAEQGYAVLQPNYRGSALQYDFLAAGFGQFGRKMQTDLSDGVRYLVAQGIVDPARVCIVGASYGGYAALAGVTLETGVYRCAVSVAGVSNLRQFLQWVDDKHLSESNREQRYWDRFLGVPNRKDPKLDEISPIRHVAAISVPVLLIHGKDDTVVPYDQSDDMYDALRAARKKVEFVKLKDEDHWLSRSETRLQMLREVVRFLQENNPPQ